MSLHHRSTAAGVKDFAANWPLAASGRRFAFLDPPHGRAFPRTLREGLSKTKETITMKTIVLVDFVLSLSIAFAGVFIIATLV